MYKEKIVDLATGLETFRDYTATEITEVEKNQAAALSELEAKAAKAAEKAAATAKLAALGLTEDDLKALGLGGN